MPLPDLAHEAAVLRAALALGLVRETAVSAWADERLQSTETSNAELTDVALAPPELTAQREALRPLAVRANPQDVGAAVRHMTLHLLRSGDVPARTILQIASDARREELLTPHVAADIKTLVDRESMASVGMTGVLAPTAADLEAALSADLEDARYLMSFTSRDECAAFVAALARKLVRDRRVGQSVATVWRSPAAETPICLFLDEGALAIAEREFGPLRIASRVPYIRMPSGCIELFDTRTAEPLGYEQANELLHAS